MKISGFRCETKFWLLVFLGHPNDHNDHESTNQPRDVWHLVHNIVRLLHRDYPSSACAARMQFTPKLRDHERQQCSSVGRRRRRVRGSRVRRIELMKALERGATTALAHFRGARGSSLASSVFVQTSSSLSFCPNTLHNRESILILKHTQHLLNLLVLFSNLLVLSKLTSYSQTSRNSLD